MTEPSWLSDIDARCREMVDDYLRRSQLERIFAVADCSADRRRLLREYRRVRAFLPDYIALLELSLSLPVTGHAETKQAVATRLTEARAALQETAHDD